MPTSTKKEEPKETPAVAANKPGVFVCRYVGYDDKLEAMLKAKLGKDPDHADFGFPSVGKDIYRVRILEYAVASQEAGEQLVALVKDMAGIEQFVR